MPPLAPALPPSGTDTTTLIVDTISGPESLDPAWAYDAASEEVIKNIYDPLISFDVDYTAGPYAAGKTDFSWILAAVIAAVVVAGVYVVYVAVRGQKRLVGYAEGGSTTSLKHHLITTDYEGDTFRYLSSLMI